MTKLVTGPHYPLKHSELPTSWTVTSIEELLEEIQPGFPSGKHNSKGDGIPHIRPMNIDVRGRIDLSEIKYVDPDGNPQRLRAGDVLFNNTNSPKLIGKTAAILTDYDWAYSNHMTRLRPIPCIDPRFIAYQLHFLWMAGYFLHRCTHHVNQASFSTKPLAETVPLILAPVNEQRRISDKIDELFSKLDAGLAALERVKTNLKRYRAALLKAAVEGKLTEAWRAENPDIEPASEFLKRILDERRHKWETDQLAKFERAGSRPPKGWKDRYEAPYGTSDNDAFALPNGWVWASIDQLSGSVKYGSSAKTSEESTGVPVLRMGNIFGGELKLEQLKYLPPNHAEFPDLLLRDGDLLFNRTNSAELVGKSAVYRGIPSPCSYASYLIAVRLLQGCLPKFVAAFINSVHGRNWIRSVVSQQVGQANVNGSKLRAFTVALPPESEQAEIVRLLDEEQTRIDSIEKIIERDALVSHRLRQSILRKAFNGKLVSQAESDEPAKELLARVREHRGTEKNRNSRELAVLHYSKAG